MAQRGPSMIKIKDMENRDIMIEVDGRRFNKVNKVLTLGNMPSGRHWIRVYSVFQNRRGRTKTRMIYNGALNTRASRAYFITVDDYEALHITETSYAKAMDAGANDRWSGRENARERTYNTRPSFQSPNGHIDYMSSGQFDELMTKVKDATYESTRLDMIKSAVDGPGISANQLADVMSELSFENSRIEIAKYSYPKLSDKENIFGVLKAFKFDSSRDEFETYIKEKEG